MAGGDNIERPAANRTVVTMAMAATLLGVSREELGALIRERKIDARNGSNGVRVYMESIADYLVAKGEEPHGD